MSSNLWLKSGVYDPTRQFEFTNITNEPFVFKWNNKPITVAAGEKVQLPHHLAVHATTMLVDKIMLDEVHAEEEKTKLETRNPYFRSARGIMIGIPAKREPYENKILRELDKKSGTDAELQVIRIREEILNDLKAEPAKKIEKMSDLGISSLKEFEDINLPRSS